MNKEELKENVKALVLEVSDPTEEERALSEFILERKRWAHFSNLHAMKSIINKRRTTPLIQEKYIAAWKRLEARGCGRIVIGRRGNEDRFEWNISTQKFPTFKKFHPKPTLISPPVIRPPVHFGRLCIYLRPNFQIDTQIPTDLTIEELRTIKSCLDSFVTTHK